MHEIPESVLETPERVTQAVLQIAEMLGLYRAELARILQLQCGDIGELAAVKHSLLPGTPAWRQGVLFIRFYQALYSALGGDEIAMYHWLRAENRQLQGVPLLLLVDDDRLAAVLDYLGGGLKQERAVSGN